MAGTAGAAGSVIRWYFDLVSPFSWLALPEVEALAAGRAVAPVPVLFAGLLRHWGQLGPAEIPPKRLLTYRTVVFEAARRGIALRFPPRHPFSPLGGLRLLSALGPDFGQVRAAFETVWAEGTDIGEPAGFARLAARLGLEERAAASLAEGARERLRDATAAAAAAGVFGVPTLWIGGTGFWGADAMGLARAVLADPGMLERGEMARLAGLPGVERRR